MDAELRELLTKLCDRLDGMEKRLRVVESQSHKQITLQDYFDKYRQPPSMLPGVQLQPAQWLTTTIC